MSTQTDDQSGFILKHTTVFLYVLGAVFVLVGAVMFVFAGEVPILIKSIFAGVGLLLIFLAKSTLTVVDRIHKKITITTQGILRKKTVDIDFAQVKEVSVEEHVSRSTSREHGTSTTRTYALILRCKDGNGYTLKSVSQSLTIAGIAVGPSPRKTLGEKGTHIAGIIGVPFTENLQPTFGEIMNVVTNTVKENMAKARSDKA